ncbi:MAG: hypothetical protein ABEJ31_05055 [Haloarculaceae archaeon]
MAAGAAFAFALMVVLVLAVPLALFVLVDREAEQSAQMDRDAAERAVRRDTAAGPEERADPRDGRERTRSDEGTTRNHWDRRRE